MERSRGPRTQTIASASTAAPAPRLPTRWRLLRRAGAGGQGEVWLAHDRDLDQRVALKLIPVGAGEDARERARREARLGRALEHPRLVRVFDLVSTPDHLVVVMEWLSGGSLRTVLEQGPLEIGRVREVAEQVLEALAHLHRTGVVHRDVKVSNLILDAAGGVKLGDLGLVRQDSDPELTRTGMAMGTPAYMSPEQLRGARPGPRSDLYALGVTLHQLLTGIESLEAEGLPAPGTGAAALRRVRSDCPRWLAVFVARLLEARPENRWADADAALRAFRRRRSVSPRLARRGAAAVGVAVAIGGGWVVADWPAPVPARVAVLGEHLAAFSSDGEILWRVRFAGDLFDPVLVDLVGDQTPEAVVAEQVDDASGTRRSWIAVLDRHGRELMCLAAGQDLGSAHGFSPSAEARIVWTGDLDGDDRSDLLWVATHQYWYPSRVEAWLSGTGRVLPMLENAGHIRAVEVGDFDLDGRQEVATTGVNNPLGWQQFVAVVRSRGLGASSPDHLEAWTSTRIWEGLHAYVVLGPVVGDVTSFDSTADGLVLDAGRLLRLTFSGVPRDWSSAARPASARMRFWSDLVALAQEIELEPEAIAPGWRVLREGHPHILGEGGSRLAADLLLARSAAAGGGRSLAIEHLADAVRRDPEASDRWLRLGELQLMEGAREAGRDAIRRSYSPHGGRTVYDPMVVLGLDTALVGSEEELDESVGLLTSTTGTFERYRAGLQAVLAFSTGRWDDPRLDAGEELPLFPYVRVLRGWAALERGAPADEILATAAELQASPATAVPARLLEAWVRLRRGEPARAEGIARQVRDEIERPARTSYEIYFWLPLAEAIQGEALLLEGRHETARERLAAAARRAPSTWYGRRAAALLGS